MLGLRVNVWGKKKKLFMKIKEAYFAILSDLNCWKYSWILKLGHNSHNPQMIEIGKEYCYLHSLELFPVELLL